MNTRQLYIFMAIVCVLCLVVSLLIHNWYAALGFWMGTIGAISAKENYVKAQNSTSHNEVVKVETP